MGTRIHSYTAPCPTLCILQGRVASYLVLAVSSPSMNTKPLRFHTLGDLSPRDEESIDQEGSAIKHFTQLPRWCKGTSRITNPRYPTFHFISKESEPLQILHSFLCTHGPHHTQVPWESTFSPPWEQDARWHIHLSGG